MAKDSAIVIFKIPKKNVEVDIETPLNITANEFVIGIASAFNLKIDTSDIKQCYLKAENPIALLKGNKLLSEFGVRNGTIINYSE